MGIILISRFFIVWMFLLGVSLVWLVMWKMWVFIVIIGLLKVVLSIMLVVLWFMFGSVLRVV